MTARASFAIYGAMPSSRRTVRLLHPLVPVQVPHAAGFLATTLTNCFEELGISAALYSDPEWYPLHNVPNVADMEVEHGVEDRRVAYNDRCLQRVQRNKRLVLGEHAGFFDLFVPVGDGRRVWSTLVTGPFGTARPSAGDLIERWHWLTGTHPRPSDPSFARYAAWTLGTLTLEGALLDSFKQLTTSFANLLAGRPNHDRLGHQAARARIELAHARFAHRMWDAAETMVDEKAYVRWLSTGSANALAFFGLAELPEHVVVALLVSREPHAEPISELLRRDAFQRQSAALANEIGGVVGARVGDHGMAFLVDEAGRRGSKLARVAERAAALARSHGFRMHAGLCDPEDPRPLWAKYRTALAGAEQALSLGKSVVRTSPARGEPSLRELRSKLSHAAGPYGPSFDRYLEAVAVHSGYRLDPARAHLEAGFERVIESLEGASAIDGKSVEELRQGVDRIALGTSTMRELFSEYRRLVAGIDLAISRPTAARRERSTQRAVDYVRDHLGERVRLDRAAKIAGFAPTYFSRLFKREQGMTFEAYRSKLRLERAKQLLAGTSLGIERIGQLCGYGTRHYFHRALKASTGITPAAYRAKSKS
jgi:AraC-like DNA-binding protein